MAILGKLTPYCQHTARGVTEPMDATRRNGTAIAERAHLPRHGLNTRLHIPRLPEKLELTRWFCSKIVFTEHDSTGAGVGLVIATA